MKIPSIDEIRNETNEYKREWNYNKPTNEELLVASAIFSMASMGFSYVVLPMYVSTRMRMRLQEMGYIMWSGNGHYIACWDKLAMHSVIVPSALSEDHTNSTSIIFRA